MKLKFGRVFAIALSATLIFTLTACVNSAGDKVPAISDEELNSTTKEIEEIERELYKVDVFTMLGNYSGEQTGWFAKTIKDKFNMELNMIASNIEGGDTKFATMMASGNLGDIVIFGNDTDNKWTDALEGGFLLDWTENDLLEIYGSTIVSHYGDALEKNRIISGRGDSIYGIGFEVSNMPSGPSEGDDMTFHSNLRWDLYEKLGRPELNSLDDLLDVLKQMQELEPVSESGRPTYGFSMWSDWDGTMVMNVKVMAALFGLDEGDGYNEIGFLLVAPDEEVYEDILDPEGFYIKTLRLYNKANQMGLVDPDSISQTFEDVQSKYEDGQVLFSWFPWLDNVYNTHERKEAGKGFKYVPIKGQRVVSYGYNKYGGHRVLSIGSKAKHPERIMEFFDWLYTPEGVMTSFNGPEGLAWEMKDGKPVVTEYGIEALPANPIDVPDEYGGGNFYMGFNQMNFEHVKRTSLNPVTNEPYQFSLWTHYLETVSTTLDRNWTEAMGGALTVKEYLKENDMLAIKVPVFTGEAPARSDDLLTQKRGQVAEVIKQYSWQMIYAYSDTEFDNLLEEMIVKAKGLGYDEVVEWNIEQLEPVFEFIRQNK